ncbi:MAG: hypothetical protein IMZ53_11535 [Thermoplasmata archaeon]|nr:hypothetical protein [Thermoplasmata archaeon]
MITNKLMIKIENLTKSTSWKLLAWSGFWFIPSGMVLGLIAWQPTPLSA